MSNRFQAALLLGCLSVLLMPQSGVVAYAQYNSNGQYEIQPGNQTGSYAYPPFQASMDKPIEVKYYTETAQSVSVDVENMRTGKHLTYPMTRTKDNVWVGTIPPSSFGRSDEIRISFRPVDPNGQPISNMSGTVTYDTLNTPESYKNVAVNNTKVRIVPFQKHVDSSPAINVYWPGLFYSKKPPYPVAARVSSSRAPQNSVRKLDPIIGKTGWFQFQVPSLWYVPGEEITIDLTSSETQQISTHSDYPTESNSEFVPVESLRFRTLSE